MSEMHAWIYRYKYDGVWFEIEVTASTRARAMAQGRNEALGMISHQSIERVKPVDYDKTIEPECARCEL